MLADNGYDGDDVRALAFDARGLAGGPAKAKPQRTNRLRLRLQGLQSYRAYVHRLKQ